MGRDGTRRVGIQMNPKSGPGRRDVAGGTLSAGELQQSQDPANRVLWSGRVLRDWPMSCVVSEGPLPEEREGVGQPQESGNKTTGG